jgi:hypothetical protein
MVVDEPMAIGFSMSAVNEVLVDPNESALYFELKNVRYKIVIDDVIRAEEVIRVIQEIIKDKKQSAEKPKSMPDFYKQL